MMKRKSTRLERNGVLYSIPVYGYIDPLLKEDMDWIKEVNPHHNNSQMVQDALAAYVPGLRQRLEQSITFRKPSHGATSKRLTRVR